MWRIPDSLSPFVSRLRSIADRVLPPNHDGTDSVPHGDIASGRATLLVGSLIACFLFWQNQQPMAFEEYYLLNTALLLGAPMVLILLFLRRDVREWGFQTGNGVAGVRFAVGCWILFLPILFVVAPQRDFQQYYLQTLLGGSRTVTNLWPTPTGLMGGIIHWDRLLFHETVLCFYMLTWEWFFRGFLLYGIRKAFPVGFALFIQAFFFMLLHWNKPIIEVASSFVGGFFLGFIALRCRSFLPCFILHWLISSSFDVAVLYFHFRH